MGQRESPPLSSDKRLWNQIYITLKEMLKSQRSQIETLIDDREFLEDYVHLQHENWCNRSLFLESQIAQIKREQRKTCLVEDAKMAVFVGFKESEKLCYKVQLEHVESDLEDFRSCMEAVSAEMEELKEKLKAFEVAENAGYTSKITGPSENSKGRDQSVLSLKMELKKLKRAYTELSSRKDTEVSALLAEKDFVWNQFKKMEDDYIGLLKKKRAEADQDKKDTEKLQNSIEKLVLSINEKDDIIANLETQRAILELDVRKHAEEAEHAFNKMKKIHSDMDEQCSAAKEKEELIANLREEICNLKEDLKKNTLEKSRGKNKSESKCRNGLNTFTQNQRCSGKYNLESCDTNTSVYRRSSCEVTFRTPAPDNRLHGELSRKRGRALSPAGIQSSLFHSDFKVPKLKRSTPLGP